MYKTIVHKGDYITYMRGDRIVTEPVDVIYKQIKDRECINSDIISIRKCRSYIEADPISIFDSLSYLYGVEVYDDNDELMNSNGGTFNKCQLSNTDDVLLGRTDIDDAIDIIYAYLLGYLYRSVHGMRIKGSRKAVVTFKNNTSVVESSLKVMDKCIASYNKLTSNDFDVNYIMQICGDHHEHISVTLVDSHDNGFIYGFIKMIHQWYGNIGMKSINAQKRIPHGILNARRQIRNKFIDGLVDYMNHNRKDVLSFDEIVYNLYAEGVGKQFAITYRLLLEPLFISYKASVNLESYRKPKVTYNADNNNISRFDDAMIKGSQKVEIRRGKTLSSRAYIIESREILGVNGYKLEK